jgi:hypothetical protein
MAYSYWFVLSLEQTTSAIIQKQAFNKVKKYQKNYFFTTKPKHHNHLQQ